MQAQTSPDFPAADLVRRDAKGYKSGNGTPFIVAQIEVVGKGLLDRKEELLEAMRHEQRRPRRGALRADGHRHPRQGRPSCWWPVMSAPRRAPSASSRQTATARSRFPGVMSRKKQVAPKLLATL